MCNSFDYQCCISLLSLFPMWLCQQTARADQATETDMHSEYARQREHLERSVASLRKKLAKDTEITEQTPSESCRWDTFAAVPPVANEMVLYRKCASFC